MVVVPALGAAAVSVGGLLFKASAASKAAATAGVAAIGASKLGLAIAGAIKLATAVIGVGKITILPFLIAAIAYYNYDLFDPENRPFNVQQVELAYDFIIIGGGSAALSWPRASPRSHTGRCCSSRPAATRRRSPMCRSYRFTCTKAKWTGSIGKKEPLTM